MNHINETQTSKQKEILLGGTGSVPSNLESLFTSFNGNPDNTKIIDYISTPNLFDVIGKSRHEMVHSRMLKEILAGRYFLLSKKKTLIHFLDIIEYRARQQKVFISPK